MVRRQVTSPGHTTGSPHTRGDGPFLRADHVTVWRNLGAYADFKRRAINPAVAEINEKTDLRVLVQT
jgi:hypothetical protein